MLILICEERIWTSVTQSASVFLVNWEYQAICAAIKVVPCYIASRLQLCTYIRQTQQRYTLCTSEHTIPEVIVVQDSKTNINKMSKRYYYSCLGARWPSCDKGLHVDIIIIELSSYHWKLKGPMSKYYWVSIGNGISIILRMSLYEFTTNKLLALSLMLEWTALES